MKTKNKKIIMAKKMVLIFAMVLFLVGFVSAETYYVSWDGDGETIVDGDTFCNGECQSGDIIEFASGVDTLLIQDLRGTIENPIIIRNSPAGKATINAVGKNFGISLVDCEFIKITGTGAEGIVYGIGVEGAQTIGIRSGGATETTQHLEIEYVEITSLGGGTEIGISIKQEENSGISLNGPRIHDCYIQDIDGEALYIGAAGVTWPDIQNVEIYDNIISDIGLDAIQVRRAIKGSNKIFDNVVTNFAVLQKQGHAFCMIHIDFVGEIYNNKCIITNPQGLIGRAIGAAGSQNNIVMYNNVIDMAGQGIDGIGYGSSSGSVWTIYQNTIANVNDDAIEINSGVTATIRDNIICGPGGSYIQCSGTCTDTNNLKNACSANYFKDLTNDDFSLTAESPARDAGSASGYPPTDIIGTVRPQGIAPDIGAYEYLQSTTTCQSEGHQCCDSCESGPHPEFDADCFNQVCCDSCYVPISSSLANSDTMIANSNNFALDHPVEHLWDGCLGGTEACTSGAGNISSFWVEFDFGQNYNINSTRLFGDDVGNWVSESWTFQYKINSGDSWTTAFSGVNALFSDWVEQNLNVNARYVKVEVFGNQAIPATQARELEIYGTAVSGSSCGDADTNTDGEVDIVEIINYMASWKAGSVTIENLMIGIGEWKNGC